MAGYGSWISSRPGPRRRSLLTLLTGLLVALMLSSCATLSLRPYNPRGHGSVYSEWAPHRGAGEWWYVTGVLGNRQQGLWLYQFTIFHEARLFGEGYLVDLALSNYSTGRRIFKEYSTSNARVGFVRGESIVVGKSSITLTHRNITLKAISSGLAFSFTMTPEKPPVWEANDGVVEMGQKDRSDQVSYYYSFTRLRTSGTLSYTDRSGKEVVRHLSGSSWLDRQWGDFTNSGWDWFSIRLFDGRDIMLYAFPATDLRQGTLIGRTGASRKLTQFTYRTNSWQTRLGSHYGLSWQIDLPSLGEEFRVVALSKDDFNANRVMPYWEGLCEVYNRSGALVGYAVEETTAAAHKLGKIDQ